MTDSINLTVTNEEDRKNRFISSILFSRATIFHPASRLTSTMKNKLIEVAQNGGTDQNNPLESVTIKSYGKNFQVDLHVDYLLQSHRDILETMLAYAQTIQLDDESYEAGSRLSWSNIYKTVKNGDISSSQSDNFDSFIDRDATVLSMSMYELATRMGMTTTRANYNQIERKIIQLSTAHLIVNELDDQQNIVGKKSLKFVQDYRFYCDRSKFKRKTKDTGNLTNHVFLVPDMRLLQAIRDHGYYYRLEQHKMTHYSKPSVRSFLKYIMTHKPSFLHQKMFEWALDSYIHSIASPVSHSFRSDLRKDLLNQAVQIEMDFQIQIREGDNGLQLIYVGDDN
ncbi:DNA mismatch repair protein [Vibrio rarus]|uniref:DNA mismatch repair protein n=1 Tax=Vibrio rarus TaxID=413403 RepID=UPI0021C4454D|nr:DNA mismatch repair protein [Vibrio rarus]